MYMYDAFIKDPPKRLVQQVAPEKEIPTRKDVSPFVASNKGGIPVTRLRAVITLRDRSPAFLIQKITPVKTPHIRGGVGGLGNGMVPIQSKAGREFVSLPSRGVRGNGGVLFLPRPGSNTIELYAWNVERLSLSRNCSNEQHAEIQFLNWLEGHIGQYPGFVSRIRSIRLYINKSPCAACTEDLCAFAKKHKLVGRIRITWEKLYNGACGSTDLQKLEQCRFIPPKRNAILFETPPQLKQLKLAKQQQHTYMFDKRVHVAKPKAVNRRLERLMQDKQQPASLLARVFASPHNYTRLKRLFQHKIDRGDYRERKDGGYEAVLSFKFNTGWSYGKPVRRLKLIMDRKGGWHYFPVP